MRGLLYVVLFLIGAIASISGVHAQTPRTTVFLPSISSASSQSRPEERNYEQKYSHIEDLLKAGLKTEYANITYHFLTQNDEWMYGYVLAQPDLNSPSDSYNFLVKVDGSSTTIAYLYTETFDEWLDIVPDSIIEQESKRYLYSSKKYAQVSGIAATASEPQLSFPWREGFSWRFSSGPHNALGEGHNEHPWSGIDFGVPYASDGTTTLDNSVITSQGGQVLSTEPNCSVTIGFEGGWAIRYLHITDITANPNQSIEKGATIAKVNLINPCHLSSGPHLHIDLLLNNNYVDFDNHYIGGWLVKQGTIPYQGSLSLDSTLTVNASQTRYGRGSVYIENRGFTGEQWFIGPVLPSKSSVGATLCKQLTTITCYFASSGTNITSLSIRNITQLLLAKGYVVEFSSGTTSTKVASADSPNASFSCLDFDLTDLQNYNFPGTQNSLRENSSEILVTEGSCNQSDRPTKTSSPTNPDGSPPITTEPNYGCSNQTSGVKFLTSGSSCFYLSSGKASLPFSPTRIEVLDTIRKYDITMCNAKGQCDEFHNTGSIDYSSVSRPFTRVELKPQGLISSDAVGSCQTSTGRPLSFGTMQAGVRYYTDRTYTVKNVDKVELIGMRFLQTPNDDKRNGDPEYITCDIKKTTQIYIAIDGRNTSLPNWVKASYPRVFREIGVSDDSMQHFDLYACTQQGGYKLRLGGPSSDGAGAINANYIIIFRDAAIDKATDCSAKFNVAPDVPTLHEATASPLYSAPLLQWDMSDRNFTDDYLQAYVLVWKDDVLLDQPDYLPIGVTQWVPPFNDVGQYKAQVFVRDSKGIEVLSNQIAYEIKPSINACAVTTAWKVISKS